MCAHLRSISAKSDEVKYNRHECTASTNRQFTRKGTILRKTSLIDNLLGKALFLERLV